jgi:hypothetical protein
MASARTVQLMRQESGWVGRLFDPQSYTPEYQELKFALHRKLLDRINLEALSSVASERVRNEVRTAVARLVEEERAPLSITASLKKYWMKFLAWVHSNLCWPIQPFPISS